MLDAEEREGSSRGRLDPLLLEQLGALADVGKARIIIVVSETLEVELDDALGRFQSGAIGG